MSREGAIRRIGEYFERGGFFDDLARRVAIHTESQDPGRRMARAFKVGAIHTETGETFGETERQRSVECSPPESGNTIPGKEADHVEE